MSRIRLNPSGTRYAYQAGIGERPLRSVVTVVDVGFTGEVATGYSPEWLDDETLIYVGSDPASWIMSARAPDFVAGRVAGGPIGGNTFSAAAGRWVASRTDPIRVYTSRGEVWPGLIDPALSDDGSHVAMIDHTTDHLHIREWASGATHVIPMQARQLRWGSQTLCFETTDGIAGLTTPGQPVTPLVCRGRRLLKPVPVWAGERWGLWVFAHDEHGRILLAEWGSLARGEAEGYQRSVPGGPAWQSDGSGYEHDARPLAGADGRVRLVWLDPQGIPVDVTVDLSQSREALAVTTPPEDEPFEVDPDGFIEDALEHYIGPLTLHQGNIVYWPKHHEADGYGEWGRVEADWIHLEFDKTRAVPNDAGWYVLDGRWIPRRFRTGFTQRIDTTHVDLSSGKLTPFGYTIRADVLKRGTQNGKRAYLVMTADYRTKRPNSDIWRGDFEKFYYGHEGGWLRWEKWHADAQGVEVLEQVSEQPYIVENRTFLPSPRPKEEPMKAPGVEIVSYAPVIEADKDCTIVEYYDRENSPGTRHVVRRINGKLRVKITNVVGSNESSGSKRPVDVKCA